MPSPTPRSLPRALRPVASRVARRAVQRASLATTGLAVVAATLVAAPEAESGVRVATDVRPVSAGAARALAGPPAVRRWRGHPGRRLIGYRVRAGNTPAEIAQRFHAWTAELLAVNGRSAARGFYAGERIRVPVVVRRAWRHGHRVGAPHWQKTAAHRRHQPHRTHRARHHRARHHRARHHRARHHHRARPHRFSYRGNPARARVARLIVRTAHRYDVSPSLALAIAWQESGWQRRVVSSAGAIGPMQVLPATGRWMSLYVDRPLHLRRTHDNVTAGVSLLRVLRRQTGVRHTIASYYQGLGAVRRHGYYRDTKRYVANVLAHRRALRRGWNPLA